jgi:hypothetical protein
MNQTNLSYLATTLKFSRDRLTDSRDAPTAVRSQAEREYNDAAQAYAKAFFQRDGVRA